MNSEILKRPNLVKLLITGDPVYSRVAGGPAYLLEVDATLRKPLRFSDGQSYTRDGRIDPDQDYGECMIWPDAKTRTWGNYCPFKKGDLVLVWSIDARNKELRIFYGYNPGSKSPYQTGYFNYGVLVFGLGWENCELYDPSKVKFD
ncbi:hypothetical protein GCM10027051_16180 [Niabella terrae]